MRIVSLVPSMTETLSHWDRTPIACTRLALGCVAAIVATLATS